MTKVSIQRAFDGARLVKFDGPLAVVWSGGTTFNVYSVLHPDDIHEVDVFTVTDSKGRAVGREAAEKHAEEYLNRQ